MDARHHLDRRQPAGRAHRRRNDCAHGKNGKTLETVLDWKPFDYFTAEQAPNAKNSGVFTCRFEPLADGQATRLTVTLQVRANGSADGPLPWLVARLMFDRFGHGKDWAHLAQVVTEDYARQMADLTPALEG